MTKKNFVLCLLPVFCCLSQDFSQELTQEDSQKWVNFVFSATGEKVSFPSQAFSPGANQASLQTMVKLDDIQKWEDFIFLATGSREKILAGLNDPRVRMKIAQNVYDEILTMFVLSNLQKLEWVAETNKPSYLLGEPIEVSFFLRNCTV